MDNRKLHCIHACKLRGGTCDEMQPSPNLCYFIYCNFNFQMFVSFHTRKLRHRHVISFLVIRFSVLHNIILLHRNIYCITSHVFSP